MSRPPLVTTRRAALGGSMAALATTAGCTLDSLDEPDPAPDTLTSAPAADADEQLVLDVVSRLSSAHFVVHRVQHDHPGLRVEFAGLAHLHEAHAALLGGLMAPSGSVPAPDEPAEKARARVAAIERRLQWHLVRASVDASSGALASLLASMAAAVAQRRGPA